MDAVSARRLLPDFAEVASGDSRSFVKTSTNTTFRAIKDIFLQFSLEKLLQTHSRQNKLDSELKIFSSTALYPK